KRSSRGRSPWRAHFHHVEKELFEDLVVTGHRGDAIALATKRHRMRGFRVGGDKHTADGRAQHTLHSREVSAAQAIDIDALVRGGILKGGQGGHGSRDPARNNRWISDSLYTRRVAF